MQRRILKHLTKYNTLSIEQYGFTVELMTDNATYKLTTEILNAMKNKLVGCCRIVLRDNRSITHIYNNIS